MPPPTADEFLRTVTPALEHGCAESLAREIAGVWTPPEITPLLSHSRVEVRRTAVVVLGIVGDKSVLGYLTRSLHDPDDAVHRYAEDALWTLWFRMGNAASSQAVNRGLEALAEDRYDEAAAAFRRAISHDPEFAEAYNQLALAEYLRGHWRASVEACRQVLARMPNHFGAMAGLGHCHAHMGERRQAVDCYRRALSINPRMACIAQAKARLEASAAVEPQEEDQLQGSGFAMPFTSPDR